MSSGKKLMVLLLLFLVLLGLIIVSAAARIGPFSDSSDMNVTRNRADLALLRGEEVVLAPIDFADEKLVEESDQCSEGGSSAGVLRLLSTSSDPDEVRQQLDGKLSAAGWTRSMTEQEPIAGVTAEGMFERRLRSRSAVATYTLYGSSRKIDTKPGSYNLVVTFSIVDQC